MTREELLKNPEWWLANIQNDLYGIIYEYMEKHDLKKKHIAEILGVTKGYVTQVLAGDFDHKLSKLIELSLTFGKAPKFEFVDIENYIQEDKKGVMVTYGKPVELKIAYSRKTSESTVPTLKSNERTSLNTEDLITIPHQTSKDLEYYIASTN